MSTMEERINGDTRKRKNGVDFHIGEMIETVGSYKYSHVKILASKKAEWKSIYSL